MPVIGITGSFGTGKTTVAKFFAQRGAKVINADKLAHRIIKQGGAEYKKIVRLFGKGVLNRRGEIDRRKMARQVFGHRRALGELCKIIHPPVIKEIKRRIAQAKSPRWVVIDAPLLIEAGLASIVDKLIVVSANQANQIKRLKAKTGLSKKDILQRMKAQLPLEKKQQLADFTVNNNGSLIYTKKQVERIWQEVK